MEIHLQRKRKIYFDTSVISYLLAYDRPDEQRITQIFWDIVTKDLFFEICLSDVVLLELSKCKNQAKREKFFEYLSKIRYNNIRITNRISDLADKYIEEDVFTEKHRVDALHVAAASVYHCETLVSWDERHIVRRKTILGANRVNQLQGLNFLRIVTPKDFLKGGKGYDESP